MRYRLRDRVRIEPLVFGWPAWWCNVAPGTSALHARFFQLPALESYLRNPSAHYRAATDPRLAGGSFVGIPPADAPRVATLLEAMRNTYAEDVALADAWSAFNLRLREVAIGQTMEPLYAEVPAALGGLVELGYDYDNRPSLRFDEGLAWASGLHHPERQAILVRSGTSADVRSFYMSTPVLADPDRMATIPFADARIQALVDLDVAPETEERARAILHAVFPKTDPDEWLGEAPPEPAPPWMEGRVRVRYFGHACLLVEHRGASVLVDPLVPQGVVAEGAYGIADLPARIDVVVVTHAHPDHFDLETLLRIRPRVGRIVVPRARGTLLGDVSLKRILLELGYRDVVEVDTGDRIAVGTSGEIVALPFLGEHGDLLHGSKAIYAVRFDDTSLLAAADSACLDERTYERARRLVGPIGNVFMNTEVDGAPISWPFDALFPKNRNKKLESTRKCRGSNVEEGLRMLATVEAKRLFVYAMGLEPWVHRITGPASQEGSPRMIACHELVGRATERGVAARRLSGAETFLLE